MSETLSGFPFWILEFDKNGSAVDTAAITRFLSEVKGQEIAELFIFSHGWNNDRTTALALYKNFFDQVRKICDDKKPAAKIGVAGVIWPSILWPDDAAAAQETTVVATPGSGGGAADLDIGAEPPPVKTATPQEIGDELKKGYDADQQPLIDELTAILESGDDAALSRFRETLAKLLASEPADMPPDRKQPDDAEAAITSLNDAQWRELLEVLASQSPAASAGGAASIFGDALDKLREGAKAALRVATYFQMKQRAGIIGRTGLGPLVLAGLAQKAAGTRVHLIGHSFGARLVSFALAGMPRTLTGTASPVKSLFLMQGAFSHYAFAAHLPHDVSRSGALVGMAARVDGPLLTTHSLKDLAVGVAYPAASFLNRDDAAALEEQSSRWGAMGNDGAQAVDAASERLSPPGKRYAFAAGKWLNLDGNQVIIHGGLPSGAHSDIIHPHTAWAALTAARVV